MIPTFIYHYRQCGELQVFRVLGINFYAGPPWLDPRLEFARRRDSAHVAQWKRLLIKSYVESGA